MNTSLKELQLIQVTMLCIETTSILNILNSQILKYKTSQVLKIPKKIAWAKI